MIERLTPEGYEAAKREYENLLRRLAEQRANKRLNPDMDREAERSELDMIRHYLREMRTYEIGHGLALTEFKESSGLPTPHAQDFLQLLLREGLIEELPDLDTLDTDHLPPIRVEGKPISEEIIEDRR